MKTYLFPGQGSQYRGMGEKLFGDFPELIGKADEILGYSVEELCIHDPRRELNKTQFTQPVLYVVNAMSYLRKIDEAGRKPDYLAGHSLGEFNALLAAEAFSFEAGLKLVKKRGELMSRVSGGGMAAILNAEEDEIRARLAEAGLTGIDLANFNTRRQIVISGPRDEIGKAASLFSNDGVEYYPLNTSGAFHSRHMHKAGEEFKNYLKKFRFSPLQTSVIANVSARPYEDGELAENLGMQLTSPVKWSESVRYLLGQGEMEFCEMGTSELLTKMVYHIRNELKEENEESERRQKNHKAVTDRNPVDSAFVDAPSGFSRSTQSLSSNEKVKKWNDRFPVGTKVRSTLLEKDGLSTRSRAVLLFGRRAAVYLEGFKGYFDLDELVVT